MRSKRKKKSRKRHSKKKKRFEKDKHTKKPASPKTHHHIYSGSATEINSSRRATKHVPRVGACSLASIDPGCVEIGLVQLSQTVKTTNVTHALTDTQTDRRTDGQTDYLNDDTPAVVHGECGWIGGW